ncbi:MAG: hypothetical protein GX580_09850, partial [Candidatus Hydrogenedens sp.]|nr:hypothetical protein [Candidatus Hydrogenedens sp.]
VARDMGAQVVIAVDVSQGIREDESVRTEAGAKEKDVPVGPLRLPRKTDEEEAASPMQVLEQFFEDVEKKMRRLKASWRARESKPDMLEVLVRSVRIMEAQIARTRLAAEPPDVLIEPDVGGIGTLDFQRAKEAMAAGRAAAEKALS